MIHYRQNHGLLLRKGAHFRNEYAPTEDSKCTLYGFGPEPTKNRVQNIDI